jgi:hypothetical protein
MSWIDEHETIKNDVRTQEEIKRVTALPAEAQASYYNEKYNEPDATKGGAYRIAKSFVLHAIVTAGVAGYHYDMRTGLVKD